MEGLFWFELAEKLTGRASYTVNRLMVGCATLFLSCILLSLLHHV